MTGLDHYGCDDVGFIGPLLQTAGGLMQGAASAEQQSEAEDAARVAQTAKLNAAVKADTDATLANARATLSQQLHMKSASSDASAAASKSAAQDAAGQGMTDDTVQKRVMMAKDALAKAQKDAAANPKDVYKGILAKAWQDTIDKLQGGGGEAKGKSGESWFSRPVLGPLNGLTVLVGAGLLIFVGKKVLSHRGG